MSCPGDNYIVPGANPCASGGGGSAGVESVTAGTNITITGTAANPIINGTGSGVTSVVAGTGITVTGTASVPIINAIAAPAQTKFIGTTMATPVAIDGTNKTLATIGTSAVGTTDMLITGNITIRHIGVTASPTNQTYVALTLYNSGVIIGSSTNQSILSQGSGNSFTQMSIVGYLQPFTGTASIQLRVTAINLPGTAYTLEANKATLTIMTNLE